MPAPAAAGRLYLVTPPAFAPDDFARRLAPLLDAWPVACLRLDIASADERDWHRAAGPLREVAHARDIAVLVAERHELVIPLGLDGVHLAERRPRIGPLRRALGAERTIGVFAGTSRHVGMTAAEAGADYVAFGPVAPAGAAGKGEHADLELFRWWAEMIEIPVVAEGGVGPAEAALLAPYADFIVPDRRIWDDPRGVGAALAAYVAALGG